MWRAQRARTTAACALVALAGPVACAWRYATQESTTTPAPAKPLSEAPTRSTVIDWLETSDTTCVPTIAGVVFGRRVAILLDTAAPLVLGNWVLRTAGGVRIDLRGRVWVRDEPVLSIALRGFGLLRPHDAFRDSRFVSLPDAVRELNIGALVPPQLLATAQRAVVVDFIAARMYDAPIEAATAEFDALPIALVTAPVRRCELRNARCMLRELRYVVQATVGGQQVGAGGGHGHGHDRRA